MRAIEILDIRQFMQLLLQSDTFNQYELVSGEIRTDMLYTIDGHINRSYFSDEEISSLSLADFTYLPWSIAKQKVFELIKGKKTPSGMKLVLRLPNTISTPEIETNSPFQPSDIDGIYLNIAFQSQKLNVICGISYKIFTLDKLLEDHFHTFFTSFFKSKNITCQ